MSQRIDVFDIVFSTEVQDPFSDGYTKVPRLTQTHDRRFTVTDDGGLLKICTARREVWVGKANVAYMIPMTPEKHRTLGPNPLDKTEKAGGK